ncbi:MAG: calcium-translocating P-type ATPase, PMCA-type [Clostridia bacterium]|nr:calcium-translocating P-type ATPase, PMCA-type [Clostridia bacterium]
MKRENGLSESEVLASREKYGSNKLSSVKRKGFFRRFFSNLSDPIIKILLVALGVNLLFALGSVDPVETFGMLAAILISTTVSTASEYGSEKAFERLRSEGASGKFRIRRAGMLSEIDIDDIVVGDILTLSSGERVPADAEIISGELFLDESAITGESREIRKSVSEKIYRGSVVCSGQAILRVISVGDATLYGGVAGELSCETRESPLKMRLTKLAKQISVMGYIAAFAVASAYFVNDIFIDSAFCKEIVISKLSDFKYIYNCLMHCLTLAVTVVVVSVPEGLPMMISVVLSSNMKKMLRDNILVRKPVGIETAGSMNILFCDKTGTLTTGKQSVCEIVTGDTSVFHTQKGLSADAGGIYDLLSLDAVFNTDSVMSGRRTIGGNSTDRAFRSFFAGGIDTLGYSVKERIPFTSEKKYSAVALVSKKEGRILNIVRGAPEIILSRVGSFVDPKTGEIKVLDKRRLDGKMKEMTMSAVRVLAVALCEKLPQSKIGEQRLTLVALVGIRDKVRRDAKKAISDMHTAGIKVVMLTGDNKDTASAVARECGIIGRSGPSKVISGQELSKMNDEEVKKLLPDIAVIARSMPGDKSRLVKIAQDCGLVVGMTGDGVNDAPALKKADVGFVVGSGTDVAKEAGDIVILDNSIISIVKAILYGRTIFLSIRKFITFQLTMNFCAVAVSLIGPFIGIDTPITVIQMLWINIMMDTLGALAFAGEAAVKETMRERPKRRNEGLLTREMVGRIIFSGLFTVGICLTFLCNDSIKTYFGDPQDSVRHLGAFFGLFIFLGIFNCFTSRTVRINLGAHLSKNRAFIVIMSFIAIFQTLMIYFGGSVLRTVPLSFNEFSFVVTLAFTVIPADIIRKISLRVIKARNQRKMAQKRSDS